MTFDKQKIEQELAPFVGKHQMGDYLLLLEEADPTPDKEYSEWLIWLIKRRYPFDDIGADYVRYLLDVFHNNKNYLWTDDIMDYHSPDHLEISLEEELGEDAFVDWDAYPELDEDYESFSAHWNDALAQARQEVQSKHIVVGKSAIHGQGLLATQDLPKGYEVGTLSLIYPGWFYDTEHGRYINHSFTPNVELYHEQANDHIKVKGRLNQDVAQGEELVADYSDPLAPKPNFIAHMLY